jgi:hypothetical protein
VLRWNHQQLFSSDLTEAGTAFAYGPTLHLLAECFLHPCYACTSFSVSRLSNVSSASLVFLVLCCVPWSRWLGVILHCDYTSGVARHRHLH